MNYQEWIQEGQGQIADTVKILLYNNNSSLFERCDFLNDKIYTEPLLFSYFNLTPYDSVINLEQILWGYIEENKRPEGFNVLTNEEGVIYLPNYGYLLTSHPLKHFKLSYIQSRTLLTTEGGKNIDHKFIPLKKVNGLDIQFILYPNGLLNQFFAGSIVPNEIDVLKDSKHYENFERALNIIKDVNRPYYNCILDTVRNIYFFRGSTNSFATMSAHGVAFFNINEENEVIYFLDNIIHQCGHVIFNSISFETDKWLTVPKNTPLSKFTGDNLDASDIYGRFHGLFTQTNINLTIDSCLERKVFTGNEQHELLGRFASNMTRFGMALKKFEHANIFTKTGNDWFTFFKDRYNFLFSKWEYLIKAFNIDNQPYVFNYKVFKDTNPL